MEKRRRRHTKKFKWRIEGEVGIGSDRRLIENLVLPEKCFISAYSRAQAVKLFADRFTQHFQARVYLGNAEVYQIGALAVDQIPTKPIFSAMPTASEKMVQLSLGL